MAKKAVPSPEKVRIRAKVNGEPVDFLCEPHHSLLEALRDELGLTGAKEGCNDGNCGACSVLLDGRLVSSCLVLAAEVDGREVLTVEGLAEWPALHPLQRAFIAEDALQCGFCTPGVLMAAKALLDRNPDPTEDEIRRWLAGNLCRCTGYETIVRAVRAAARTLRGETPAAPPPAPPAAGYRVIGSRPPARRRRRQGHRPRDLRGRRAPPGSRGGPRPPQPARARAHIGPRHEARRGAPRRPRRGHGRGPPADGGGPGQAARRVRAELPLHEGEHVREREGPLRGPRGGGGRRRRRGRSRSGRSASSRWTTESSPP